MERHACTSSTYSVVYWVCYRMKPWMSVRHALLALLSEGPKYGLQLRQEFEARHGRGVAAQRRAGVHDAPAAGA